MYRRSELGDHEAPRIQWSGCWPFSPFDHDSRLCRSSWNLVLIADGVGEGDSSVENESKSLKTALVAVEAGRELIAYSRRAPEEARSA